jgi:DegV family protein with EDD domain
VKVPGAFIFKWFSRLKLRLGYRHCDNIKNVDRVIVVTDSNATVPPDILQELDIKVVPLILNIGGKSFKDGLDITPNEFYRQQRILKYTLKTSSPSVVDFLNVYKLGMGSSKGIVSIHLPGILSGTLEVARTASQLVEGVEIIVMDSNSVAMGQGFVVIEAARVAAEGKSLNEVKQRARDISQKMHFIAMLDTLEYLQRGGRIGGVAALMGMMLKIKPVVTMRAGRVEPLAKPRTKTKALEYIMDQMKNEIGKKPVHIAVLHTDVQDEAVRFSQLLKSTFDCVEMFITELTPVMGAHGGPGVLGTAFYSD